MFLQDVETINNGKPIYLMLEVDYFDVTSLK